MFIIKEYQRNSHARSYSIRIFIFIYYFSWPGAGAETSTFRLRLQPKVPAPCGSGSTTLVLRQNIFRCICLWVSVAEQKLFVSAPAPIFKKFRPGSDYTVALQLPVCTLSFSKLDFFYERIST
jgi:hypothetical protein